MTIPARPAPTRQYLRLDGSWQAFQLSGLEAGDSGSLTLARLPFLGDALTGPLAPLPGLDGPAGIGVAPCGAIYIADPAGHRILHVDACGGAAETLACLNGPGSGPGQLDTPRGVIVGPRNALYIADSGNARVVVVDLESQQLRGIWGVPRSDPRPSDAPGGFVQPWDLAADRRGFIYVADPGTMDVAGHWSRGRLQKFRPDGTAVAAFTDAIGAAAERPGAPASVAVTLIDPGDRQSERVVVLDRQPPRLLVYTTDGALDAIATALWSQALGDGDRPTAVEIVDGGAIYVADAASGGLLVFAPDGRYLGTAPDSSEAAGLAIDCAGRLLLNPGGAGGSVRRSLGLPAYAECGTFLAGPFTAPDAPAHWQRVELEMDPLPAGTHLRIYTLTSNTLDGTGTNSPPPPASCGAPPDPTIVDANVTTPAPLNRWRAALQDAPDLLAANVPARFLWIAGVLQGDGSATPSITQIRLSHDEDGWIQYLPALYRRDDGGRLFLDRMLGAFESVLDISDAELDDLPLAFDANAASDAPPNPTWLEWLAGWVDAELREAWPEAQRRAVVAAAFGANARRGTIQRLRELVALHAGATPFITELGATSIWSLGVSTSLGLDTALAEMSAQGAVLDATAVVDHSMLTDGSDLGVPAFAGAAHRFAVRVYEADLEGPDGMDRVRAVLDREKPAHTTYHLCPIGPRARVGLQALVGIDTIVGGLPEPAPLGQAAIDGALLALAGELAGSRPGVATGQSARVGATIS